MKVAVFWFRRDLRLQDNTAFYHALQGKVKVLPIFIFDDRILNELPKNDPRVNFIYDTLKNINATLQEFDCSLLVLKGDPLAVWNKLLKSYSIERVYVNEDYEPYGIQRDDEVQRLLTKAGVEFKGYQDHVIQHPSAILKNDGTPYTVYTPYKRKWLEEFKPISVHPKMGAANLLAKQFPFPDRLALGIEESAIKVLPFSLDKLDSYGEQRDFPAMNCSSKLGPHLRFGTISPRQVILQLQPINEVFLSELIWREFFIQILYHFPKVVSENFKPKYNGIKWRNNAADFEKWKKGETGYPLVDAGMKELNETGYMHNRVRMITAGFLCKHLMINWQWGEAYFAEKLLDFELASNNGNWQWSAGTGCDAAPYFRIFNPSAQLSKFDSRQEYINKWLPGIKKGTYPLPMVDHVFARLRALASYKEGLKM